MQRLASTVTFLVLALVAWPAAAGTWPQLGGNPQHTGYSAEDLRPPFRIKWNVQFQPERLYPAVQPVVADGRAFLGTESGNFYAISMADGARAWKYPAEGDGPVGPILHTAAVADGRVFFASMDGCVYALEAATGKKVWKFDSRMRTGFSAAVLLADGNLFAVNRGGTVFTLKPSDGSEVWAARLDCPLLQSPAWNDGRLYVAGMDMRLYALDSKTGRVLWKTEPIRGVAFKDYWPLVYRGMVIVRPMGGREGFAFQEATGKPVDLPLPGAICMNGALPPPCVDGEGQLVTSATNPAMGKAGWARVNVETKAVQYISTQTEGVGNSDENMTPNAAGRLIFVMHCEEGNAQYTGCYDIPSKTWTRIKAGPWLNMVTNCQGGGASQALAVDGVLLHVSMHGLRCFVGGAADAKP